MSTAASWKDVRVEDHEQGLVSTWGEFKGSVAMQVDLQHFPFDESKLECRFTGGRLRDGTPSNKQEFVLMDRPPPETRFENLGFLNIVPLDFENRCSHQMVGLYTKRQAMGDVSTVTFGFVLRRNSQFYLWRCLFVLWTLFVCSLSAYSIDGRQMGSRVEVSATLLVGAMAVLFTFSSEMPKTGSLNRLDWLFISTISMMILPVVETAAISRYLLSTDAGVWPDKQPTESAVNIARQVDYTVGGLSVVLYVGLNIFFWFLPSARLNKTPYIPQNGISAVWKYMPWSADNALKFCKFKPQHAPTLTTSENDLKPAQTKIDVKELDTSDQAANKSPAAAEITVHTNRTTENQRNSHIVVSRRPPETAVISCAKVHPESPKVHP